MLISHLVKNVSKKTGEASDEYCTATEKAIPDIGKAFKYALNQYNKRATEYR